MTKGSELRGARFTIRLSDGLRAAIAARAAQDRRSPSDWIVLAHEKAAGYAPPPEVGAMLGLKKKPRRR